MTTLRKLPVQSPTRTHAVTNRPGELCSAVKSSVTLKVSEKRDACCSLSRQTTLPSLKIGRYMAITSPPMSVPSTTMIIGSMRLDSASTASSTSCSK